AAARAVVEARVAVATRERGARRARAARARVHARSLALLVGAACSPLPSRVAELPCAVVALNRARRAHAAARRLANGAHGLAGRRVALPAARRVAVLQVVVARGIALVPAGPALAGARAPNAGLVAAVRADRPLPARRA